MERERDKQRKRKKCDEEKGKKEILRKVKEGN